MVIEFNPGHRHALEKIGILKSGESSLTVEELTERTLAAGGQIEFAIYTVKQEFVQTVQKFLLIDSRLEQAKNLALAITDQASLAEAEELLVDIVQELDRIRATAEVMRDYVAALKSVKSETRLRFKVVFSAEADRNLDQIESEENKLAHGLRGNEGAFLAHIAEIGKIIQEKGDSLGN